jgi:hypothetical protein
VIEADVGETDGALDAVPEIPIAGCERLLKGGELSDAPSPFGSAAFWRTPTAYY